MHLSTRSSADLSGTMTRVLKQVPCVQVRHQEQRRPQQPSVLPSPLRTEIGTISHTHPLELSYLPWFALRALGFHTARSLAAAALPGTTEATKGAG